MKNFVVTIDGFAGVGKSTVARKTAERLNALHINSGLIYRAIAYKIISLGYSTKDEKKVSAVLGKTELNYAQPSENIKDLATGILLDGQLISDELHTQSVSNGASEVANFVDVRDLACRLQRMTAQSLSVVAEGRDAGTIVFPNADLKFFLTTSTAIAAKRRLGQLRPDIRQAIEKSPEQFQLDLKQIESEIIARNLRDASNKLAPTVKANDAIEIDTSSFSADEVVERIVQIVNSQLEKNV